MTPISILLSLMIAASGCDNVGQKEAPKPTIANPNPSDSGADITDNGTGDVTEGKRKGKNSEGEGGGENEGKGENASPTCDLNFSTDLASPVTTSGSAQVPILGQINFNMTADVEVDALSEAKSGSIAIDAVIKSFSPSIGRSLAQKVVDSYKDPLKLTYVASSSQKSLPDAFQKISCYFPPVQKIVNSAYEIEYKPGVPFLFNANTKESVNIPSATFDVEARIIRHPSAAAGTHKGKVKVSISSGKAVVEFDFGGVAPRANATPVKSLKYVTGGAGEYSELQLSAFVSDNSLITLKVGE
jgi:hypothetical protein